MPNKKNIEEFNIEWFRMDKIPSSCSWIIIGGPGSGKCFGIDTEILMADNTVKKVQDIKKNDLVMGANFQSKRVIGITKGVDEMFLIKQNWEGQEDYIVNKPHILCLVDIQDLENLITITVEEYLKLEKEVKDRLYGVKICPKTYVKTVYPILVEYLKVDEYFGFELKTKNKLFLLKDHTIVHNTSLIKDIAYVHKHKIPVAKIHSGSEDSNMSYSENFPKLFITDGYDEEQEKLYITRQKRCKINGCNNGSSLNIVDDCSDDTAIYRSSTYQALYKNGTRHYNHIFITGLQYGVDFKPDIRKCSSYTALFFEANRNEREKLYKNFGGACGTFEEFQDIMDQMIEGDHPSDKHTCMIIKNFDATPNRNENVFLYKANLHPNFKFGCKEYIDWDAERRDTKKGVFTGI